MRFELIIPLLSLLVSCGRLTSRDENVRTPTSVKQAEVKKCLSDGYSKAKQFRGIAAAVVSTENFDVLTFGEATPEQIFEIGSITKTMTGSLLALAQVRNELRVQDAIPQEYQKAGHPPITYEHLATHSSGIIPGVFESYNVVNPESPYDGLTISAFKNLYHHTALKNAPGTKVAYSNIGTSLLGLILSEKRSTTYEQLVDEEIFKPLGMRESFFEVPGDREKDYRRGIFNGKERSRWDLHKTAISPAGSIRSTIRDMSIYARSQLNPSESQLGSAFKLAHKPIRQFNSNLDIGLNWIVDKKNKYVWHNGSTGAFSSILIVSHADNLSIVALTDTGISTIENGSEKVDDTLQNVAFACMKK